MNKSKSQTNNQIFPNDYFASQTHGHMSVQFKGAPSVHMRQGAYSSPCTPPNAYGQQAGGPQGYSTITSLRVDKQTSVASDVEK